MTPKEKHIQTQVRKIQVKRLKSNLILMGFTEQMSGIFHPMSYHFGNHFVRVNIGTHTYDQSYETSNSSTQIKIEQDCIPSIIKKMEEYEKQNDQSN